MANFPSPAEFSPPKNKITFEASEAFVAAVIQSNVNVMVLNSKKGTLFLINFFLTQSKQYS